MTVKGTVILGALCLVAGGVVGYAWHGKVLDRQVLALEARYAQHLRDDSSAALLDASRTDTVVAIRYRTDTVMAQADTLSRVIAGKVDTVRAACDSAPVFEAWAAAVQRRDSLRLATIASLNRVVAVQDSQLVALREGNTRSNALLVAAMASLKAEAARAGQRWHLAAFVGYGASQQGGTVHASLVLGIGIAYQLW